MENLLSTLFAAALLIFIGLLLLSLSYWLVGKSNLKPGACGRAPFKNKDNSCGTQNDCPLCKPDQKKDKEL